MSRPRQNPEKLSEAEKDRRVKSYCIQHLTEAKFQEKRDANVALALLIWSVEGERLKSK
jgi:hypothetical protein